jgi:hypothetical protein
MSSASSANTRSKSARHAAAAAGTASYMRNAAITRNAGAGRRRRLRLLR